MEARRLDRRSRERVNAFYATALARFTSSVVFGALWLMWGWQIAVMLFMIGLIGAVSLSHRHITMSAAS